MLRICIVRRFCSTAASGNVPLSDTQIHPTLIARLEKAGITELFPVQAETIGPLLEGKDVVARCVLFLPLNRPLLPVPTTARADPSLCAH